MARIISGGFKGGYSIPSSNQSVAQESPKNQENILEYGLRNVAKIPTYAYEAARTLGPGAAIGGALGGPVGAVLGAAGSHLLSTAAQEYGNEPIRQAGEFFSPQQANKEISAVLPPYFTEHREGDLPAEIAIQSILGGLGGGARTAGQLAKSTLKHGATAGAAIGAHKLAKEATGSETAAALTGLGTGLGTSALLEQGLPSRTLPKKISQNIQETEPIKAYDSRIQNLDALRKQEYAIAEKFPSKKRMSAPKISSTITDVEKDLFKGVSKADQKLISHNIEALKKNINPRNKELKLSLDDAKKLQKNFNDQIYDRSASVPFKNQMRKVTKSLNEFIAEAGGEEHNKAWQAAEKAHQEYSQLKKDRKQFISEVNQEKRDIKQADLLEKIYSGIKYTGAGTLGKEIGGLTGLPGGKYVGGLAGLAVNREANAIFSTLKKHPDILNAYKAALKDSALANAPQTIATINKLNNQVRQLVEEEEAKPKIISGGLKGGYKF